jgi:hypothetical protein
LPDEAAARCDLALDRSTAEIEAAGRVMRVDALFAALRERRLMTGDTSTRVILTVEPDVPPRLLSALPGQANDRHGRALGAARAS